MTSACNLIPKEGTAAAAEATETEEKTVNQDSPIAKLFSSEQSLREGLVGKAFVSDDHNCLIDFRRETRYQIFIKEPGQEGWTEFEGQKYHITYNSNDQLCIEFEYLEPNGGGQTAKALFTPEEFALTFFHANTLNFNNFKIVTADEARTIYDEDSGK